uniref:Peroxidase n=1 Tax=Linum usitatissimum TaxID=4006 RepID=Q43782_LINUS|nr:peroxidase [Linum usitatissimum]
MAPTSSHVVALTIMLSAVLFASTTTAQIPAPAKGMSWTFYKSSCPKLESIITKRLKEVFKKDIGQAAGLLRLHFHDCFVEGCDGSVLLTGSAGGPSAEQGSPPNLSLRKEAFRIIDDLRARVHKECGRVVSCSDIVALAARDSVVLSGGPKYQVALGRRDGTTLVTQDTTLANLPPPFATTGTILSSLATKNLNPTDAVALSGAHTIGISHCSSFTDRLYPNQDPSMDQTFAKNLKATCPQAATTDNIVDIRSPNVFDNKYYVDLMNRQGLFTSDQDLYTDSRTRGIVTSFAINQTLFFEKFVVAMIKMGQISVLTGKQGEIRANCSVTNSAKVQTSSFLEEAVEEAVELLAGMR